MASLDTEMKIMIGQRICAGFEGTEVTPELEALIKDYKVGNILLFTRNIKDYDQLCRLNGDLIRLITEETGLPPFIMIDEEGGGVSRLAHIGSDTPSPMAIGATGDPENAWRVGYLIGRRLRAAGINFDLAPVLDYSADPCNLAISNRSFACDAEKTALFGKRYIDGLHDAGVYGCGKHFPGHGDTTVDSHLALPIIEKPMDALWSEDLVPFRAAIGAGVDGIMSAHIMFPEIDPDRVPCTISERMLKGLLRDRLGFQGIAISDGMEMHAMLDLFPVPEGVARALKAGIDVALVCHEPKLAAASCERIAEAVRNGEISRADMEAHHRRIVESKAAMQAPDWDADRFPDREDRETCMRIMEEAVRLIHSPDGAPLPKIDDKTVFLGCSSMRISLVNDEGHVDGAAYCAKATGGRNLGAEPDPGALEGASAAVIFLEMPEEAAKFAALAEQLNAAGVRTIAVSMHTAKTLDFMPDSAWKICCWQYNDLALDALVNLLKQA